MTKKVLLTDIDSLKEFVNHAMKFTKDITAISGRYVVDGRSIIGLLSLNLSQPITIEYDEDDAELFDTLMSKFVVR